jgi:hypothetical protein
MSAVSTDVGLLHSQLPELSLRDWAAAAVEQAVQGHIAAAFAALRDRVTGGVQRLRALDATQTGAACMSAGSPHGRHLCMHAVVVLSIGSCPRQLLCVVRAQVLSRRSSCSSCCQRSPTWPQSPSRGQARCSRWGGPQWQ